MFFHPNDSSIFFFQIQKLLLHSTIQQIFHKIQEIYVAPTVHRHFNIVSHQRKHSKILYFKQLHWLTLSYVGFETQIWLYRRWHNHTYLFITLFLGSQDKKIRHIFDYSFTFPSLTHCQFKIWKILVFWNKSQCFCLHCRKQWPIFWLSHLPWCVPRGSCG